MKYHVPGSPHYDRTDAEVWFATTEAAEKAGFEPTGWGTDHPYGEGSHAAARRRGAAPEGYPVKGNADSMKYHTPESPYYDRTVAEVWFASAEAAEAAGFEGTAADEGAARTTSPDRLAAARTDRARRPPPGDGGLVRLRLDLAYDGTDFAGWAVQPGQRTVQAEVEAALATVLRLPGVPG